LRGFSKLPVGAIAIAIAFVLAAFGCSRQTIVAVDPLACGGSLFEGMVSYWRLDDEAGSTTARDSFGPNTGTLMGLDPATVWTTGGPEGGALSVEGKGFVNVPRSTSIDSITDQVTVAGWIFLEGTLSDYATIISRQIGTGFGQTYHLSVNTQMLAGLFITTPATGQIFITSTATMPFQTWIHLAGTFDGTTARLYVNGAEVSNIAVAGPFAAETTPVILSGNVNPNTLPAGESVPGRLDGILLYRRALSSEEIARLHTCRSLTSPGPGLTDAGGGVGG